MGEISHKDMTARFIEVLLGGGLGDGAVHIADTLSHTVRGFCQLAKG